jgi:hypothetical protein
VLDLGVIRVGEAQPLHAQEISRYYEGRENDSGDYLGRAGVILAWHPSEDVLLLLNGHRLRVIDCEGGPECRAVTLAADCGRLNGHYLAFIPGRRAGLVGLLRPDEADDGHRISALGLVPLDGGPARKFALPQGFDRDRVIRSDRASLWQPVADSATFLASDRNSGRIPRSDVAHHDAAVLNGSNRMLSHGAPPLADDAERMSGKSRNRFAPVLTEACSWTSDRSAKGDSIARELWRYACPLTRFTFHRPDSICPRAEPEPTLRMPVSGARCTGAPRPQRLPPGTRPRSLRQN